STSINPKNFTESISPTSNNKHELVLKSLLKLFADKRAQITYFSMNNVPTLLLNDNYFENLRTINFGTVLMDTGIRPLFEGIRYMNLEWDALSLDGFLYALGNVCKNLDSLSTNFAHDPVSSSLFLNKQQATDLAIFICSQTSLSSFILQNYQYFTNYFLESLNTQINSLKRLEFYAVDFEGCTFEVVASCKQLEYLSIVECMNITFDIIDTSSMPSVRNGGVSEPTILLKLRDDPSMEYHTTLKTSTVLLKPSSSQNKYMFSKFDRKIPASTRHHIVLHSSNPNFTTSLPIELLKWAQSKNHPVP
ncbi:2353_t:CDS:2, partial [Ambispora leptoticha]